MKTTTPKALSILKRREVEKRTGLSRSTIYARIRTGSFPAQVNLGGKTVGWIEHEIDAWISAQIAQRTCSSSCPPSPPAMAAANSRYVKCKIPVGGPSGSEQHKGTESLDLGVGSGSGSY